MVMASGSKLSISCFMVRCKSPRSGGVVNINESVLQPEPFGNMGSDRGGAISLRGMVPASKK